jgi:hypothetical protein
LQKLWASVLNSLGFLGETDTQKEMECVLSGNHIQLLNTAVNCLAGIGNELLVEALPEKVSNLRRSTNDALYSFQA